MKIYKKIKYLRLRKTMKRENQRISILIQPNHNKKKHNFLWYLNRFQHKQHQNSKQKENSIPQN